MTEAKPRKVPHHEFYVAEVMLTPDGEPDGIWIRLCGIAKNSAEGRRQIGAQSLTGVFCVVDITVPPMLCETVDVPKTTVTPVAGGMAGVESMEPEGKGGKG